MDAPPDMPKPRGALFYFVMGIAACALAALVLFSLKRVDQVGPSGEAIAMLQNLRGAQEAYRAETRQYRSCPDGGDLSAPDSYYPRPLGELNDSKAPWENVAHPSQLCWRTLGMRADGPVRFSYAVAAGSAGPVVVPRPPGVKVDDWPFDGSKNIGEPYFVAVAVGTLRGVKTASFISSFDNELKTVTIPP